MNRSFAGSWRRGMAVALLLAFVPMTSACFGSFQLTRKAYQFNKSVSANKWVRWLVFVALGGPLYGISSAVDMVFANTLEFWTGTNPIVAKLEPQTVVGENGEVATLTPVENGARLVVTETSGAVHTVTLQREASGSLAAYDEKGQLRGRLLGLAAGEPHFADLAR
jgi:Domain of unknown function (DUF3332)